MRRGNKQNKLKNPPYSKTKKKYILYLNKIVCMCAAAAAAAKLLQLCPTLRDPMDCSLPGFSVQEISQARVLEWVDTKYQTTGKNFSN